MTDWKSARSHRNEKKRVKRVEKLEDRCFWTNLKSQYPHVMMPEKAKRLSSRLHIDCLELRFREESWIEYQKEGWRFVRVVKPEDNFIVDSDHTVKSLDNGYGDLILFKRISEIEEDQN